MASGYPSSVTAVQVGNFFVGQYYQVLQQQPDFVHQFYSDESVMTRIDGPVVETAVTMLQIHSLIMSLNFTGIEITTAHSMDSWNGGVLVIVSGSVHAKDFIGRRQFVQVFFLAPQEKGYFVLNDIFQFSSEEQVHQHPAVMLVQENYDSQYNVPNPLPESVTEYMLSGGIQSEDFLPSLHADEHEAVDKYSISESQQPISDADNRVEEQIQEPSGSYPSSMSAARDLSPPTAEESFAEPTKHTYASILRYSKGHARPSAPQPSFSNSIPVVSEWNHAPEHASVESYTPQSVLLEKVEVADEVPTLEDEGEVTSVYVRNLPSSVCASDLEQEFKKFGRIKPDGVLIKSRKDAGVYYAFVEFEDILGVQNAVKASPIPFNGRQIYAEERRPNAGLSRGRRGRGRDGYQSDGSRGRFGGRGYGRVSLQKTADRDYSSRPRGNGSHQRAVYRPQVGRNGQHPSDSAY